MSGSHSHRDRSYRRRHSTARVVLAACALAAVALALAAVFGAPIALQPNATESEPEPAAISELAAALAPRPVYRYSVVDGGVYSADEVARAVATDPAVAEHYGAIDVAKLRVETVAKPVMAYMSYRRNGNIYWTKHKVQLQQGETILTDGTTQVRARCGNCISLEPVLPTEESAPEAAEFDGLVADPRPPSQAPLVARTFPTGIVIPPEFEGASFFAGSGPSSGAAGLPLSGPEGAPPLDEPTLEDEPGTGSFVVPPVTLPPGGPSDPKCLEDCGNPPPPPKPPVLVELPPVVDPPIDIPKDLDPDDPFTPDPPVDPIPTPEPATLLLVGGGGVGLALRRWRKR